MKIISTSQGHIHRNEDLNRQIYNCNVNIYFNQKCIRKNIIPNFDMIKIPNVSPSPKIHTTKAPTIRIKVEIK